MTWILLVEDTSRSLEYTHTKKNTKKTHTQQQEQTKRNISFQIQLIELLEILVSITNSSDLPIPATAGHLS